MTDASGPFKLSGSLLCTAEFQVEGGIVALGPSPWRDRRVGYVTGGTFEGPRLHGDILPGGGNWSQAGRIAGGLNVGAFDARVVWRTHDAALIYVTYTGRSAISDQVRAEFTDPGAAEVDPSRYYIRIAPVFETGDERYNWLNAVLAVGYGHRTPTGIRHSIFEIL